MEDHQAISIIERVTDDVRSKKLLTAEAINAALQEVISEGFIGPFGGISTEIYNATRALHKQIKDSLGEVQKLEFL